MIPPYENSQHSILPLTISVNVVGVPMQAAIVEDLSDHGNNRYKVRFENGIEDIFTLIEGPENYLECNDPSNNHYCIALVGDIVALSKVDPEKFLSVLSTKIGDEFVNLWFLEEDADPGESDSVIVHYDQFNAFQLYRETSKSPWKLREFTSRPLSDRELEVAQGLASMMDTVYQPLEIPNVISSGQ